MALLNYTTSISADRTISEMQKMLATHGAKSIQIDYAEGGAPEALAFMVMTPVGERAYRLPVVPEKVRGVLERQYRNGQMTKRGMTTQEQSVRVAWRISKDWLEAQLAIIETEMVTLDQVMLPYMQVDDSGQTLYLAMIERRLQLPEGREP